MHKKMPLRKGLSALALGLNARGVVSLACIFIAGLPKGGTLRSAPRAFKGGYAPLRTPHSAPPLTPLKHHKAPRRPHNPGRAPRTTPCRAAAAVDAAKVVSAAGSPENGRGSHSGDRKWGRVSGRKVAGGVRKPACWCRLWEPGQWNRRRVGA